MAGHYATGDDLTEQTSKFSLQRGLRADPLDTETTARMFLQVDPVEERLFLESIGDPRARAAARQLTGIRTTGNVPAVPQSRTGYVDFFLQSARHPLRENVQVVPTLEGNYVVYTFDQEPPRFPYSGVLINTAEDDQAVNLLRLYIHVLRASQLARRNKVVSLRYDAYVVTGLLLNLELAHEADPGTKVPFGFELLVKKLAIVNYSIDWTPYAPGTKFGDGGADLDFAPTVARGAQTATAEVPRGTVADLAPVPDASTDDRAHDTTPRETLASGAP